MVQWKENTATVTTVSVNTAMDNMDMDEPAEVITCSKMIGFSASINITKKKINN